MRVLRITALVTPVVAAIGLLMTVTAVTASAADAGWSLTGSQRPGEPDRPVWSVASSPSHPRVLLEATQGRGVLRSTDGGVTWTSVVGNSGAAWVVHFDLQRPGSAYAGTQEDGVFKSVDEGRTWTVQNQGLTSLDVRAIDTAGDLILLGTAKGVFYSNDAAASWHPMGLEYLSIAAVALLPKATGVSMFVGADNGSAPAYLFESEDLTGGWANVTGNFPGSLTVATLTRGPAPLAGGEPPILAGTSAGLFRSDDRGNTWIAISGLPATDFNLALFNPTNGDQLYVASDGDAGSGGVFRSLDRGATWSPLGVGLPKNPRVTALALQQVSPVQVLAATWNPTTGEVGVYRIADPAAAVVATSPLPSASPTSRPNASATAGASLPVVGGSAASAQSSGLELALAAIALLLIGLVVLARRRLLRREAPRSYVRR